MMVFEAILLAFSSPALFPLVVLVTLLFIAILHFFFSTRYGHDAHKDTPAFLFGSLGLLVASSFLFGTISLFSALFLGAFLGEALGLLSVTLYFTYKHKIHK